MMRAPEESRRFMKASDAEQQAKAWRAMPPTLMLMPPMTLYEPLRAALTRHARHARRHVPITLPNDYLNTRINNLDRPTPSRHRIQDP